MPEIVPTLWTGLRSMLGVGSLTPSPPTELRPHRTLHLSRAHHEFEKKLPGTFRAVEQIRGHLFSILRKEGCWEGPVYDNATITSEYIMLLTFLGRVDQGLATRARRVLLDTQNEDGGWPIYGGGPSEHSATVEAYFALKLCGISRQHSAMKKARERILANGGIETTRVFTKISLAFFDEYPWSRIPIINPELMLLPRQSPINIYEFSSWSRAVIVPLLVIFNHRPTVRLPAARRIPELHVPITRKKNGRSRKIWDLEQIFEVAQRALGVYEKVPVKPFRKTALAAAEKWIVAHQDPCGSWCGIYPAMANSIVALHLRGYPLDHPILEKGLRALRSYAEEDPRRFRMQSTISPIWDSAIALYALEESGVPASDPKMSSAIDWLLEKQILDVYGDWRFKAKRCRPGGWPFEHENAHYPDIDDTALAILAILPGESIPGKKKKIENAVERGLEWLLGMQGSDGGWGAFDRDNNRQILNQIPFADLKSLLDPSTPDVTGHVIEAFAASGYDRYAEPIDRAIEYLEKSQEVDGSWFGRWGVDYVYGTAAVLSGLWKVGEKMNRRYIQRAQAFLEKVQNDDGGWGESCESYDFGRYVPLGYSTPSQTAWGVMGLLCCPGADPKAIERGVRWLIERQKPDGSWDEPEWTGTGFPRHFYLRYDYYRLYFPLLTLARYATWQSDRK